jgi:hypothetical protein
LSWITDLLKDVPLSAVSQERVALAEDRLRALQQEHDRLKAENDDLRRERNELLEKVQAADRGPQFVRAGGVDWMKSATGQFDDAPYCPRCQTPMHAFPPVGRGMLWICSGCDMKVNYREPPAAT